MPLTSPRAKARPARHQPREPIVQELVEYVVRGLASRPDDVQVDEVPSGRVTLYEISVADEDVGKIIGRQGKVIRALRTVAKAGATRQGIRVEVDVV
jgi:predicted RNA-binding protein YlqC (UPF0109 family)